MSVPQSVEGLPAELRVKFAAIRRWQGITRAVTVLAVIVITVMFLVFATTTRSRIEGSFTEARVQKAVAEALPMVTPLVQDSIGQIARGALPVYQQMATERYQRVRDSIGTNALARLQSLPQDGGAMMATRLDATLDRVIKRIEPDFRATFPSLADASKRDLLVNEFFMEVDSRNQEVAAKIDAIRVNETARVKFVLDKFALPPDEAAPANDQLKKELVRTLLLLAMQKLDDLEVASAGASAETPGGAVPASQTLPAAK